MEDSESVAPVKLPRVAITYCTQCKWMLRAAYFGQELLSTFGTSIGEIALIPATGGLFTVHLTHKTQESDTSPQEVLIWDRKAEGGFPETKILKQRVRNHIEPEKNLGHSDTPAKLASKDQSRDQGEQKAADVDGQASKGASTTDPAKCEDCDETLNSSWRSQVRCATILTPGKSSQAVIHEDIRIKKGKDDSRQEARHTTRCTIGA
ncbi:uncharacterized protein LTR77_003688 [Saxophila tyrrhenica]|uniref:Uncharacterized protein n=1 Tax=Saxophila tyrrhenica TaxID=1690608 RepID=A0AAV9PHR8_9PEZI|nr:hypothetical protein LTR77_003688 [Saxophila tyrrhenica]